jgi:DNA polymerase elongation subunit (family B)
MSQEKCTTTERCKAKLFNQVGELSAAECLPLVMEPISQFYSSPMLVLDFQSLYPSVMIAYNYW